VRPVLKVGRATSEDLDVRSGDETGATVGQVGTGEPSAPPPARAATLDAPAPAAPTRRGALTTVLGAVAAAVGSGTAAAAATGAVAPAALPAAVAGRAERRALAQVRADTPFPTDRASALHLVQRTTWGATPQLLAEVLARGPEAWLEEQLAPGGVDDSFVEGVARRYRWYGWSIPRVRQEVPSGDWELLWDLGSLTFARYVWGRRQLHEVMADFWSNHLNVTNPSSDVWDNRHDYDTTVVRRYALGSFADMLKASARHPAMLRYLDNASSRKGQPNENYARELMELHTLGVSAGYTELDVRAAARLLTGLTVDDASGLYRYDASRHDTGAATVLGFAVPAHSASAGEGHALSLLDWLARHPTTARHLALKLCVRFVSDDPPAALVERVAEEYLRAGTDVVPALRLLFRSPEFWASAGAKTRRPLEGYVAALRLLGVGPDASGTVGLSHLSWLSREMGHQPLAWAAPNGYPDVAVAWQSASATLYRWNRVILAAGGWWPNMLTFRPLRQLLPAQLPATYGGLFDELGRSLLLRPLVGRERTALLGFCGKTESSPLRATDEWLGWRLHHLVATVLDAPAHMVR